MISEARITNPCKKVVQEDGTRKDLKVVQKRIQRILIGLEGYTYLDQFLDEMKEQNNGEVLFVATTIGDYKVMERGYARTQTIH